MSRYVLQQNTLPYPIMHAYMMKISFVLTGQIIKLDFSYTRFTLCITLFCKH